MMHNTQRGAGRGRTVGEAHGGGAAALEQHLLDARAEAHVGAEALQLVAEAAQQAHEAVGADVGLALPQDVLRRAKLDQRVEHLHVQAAAASLGGFLRVAVIDARLRVRRNLGGSCGGVRDGSTLNAR